MKKLITNIFRSQILDSDGIKVSLFSIMGDLDEDKSERIGYWFSYKYHTPSTVYHFEGNHCLAIATDEILPPDIIDEKDNVKLKLIKTDHHLLFENENDRKTAENLMYRSIEEHYRKNKFQNIWIRSRISRTYCEHKPLTADVELGVQVFSCFNIYSEYQKDHSMALVIDSSSTLVEIKTLLDVYTNVEKDNFSSKYDGSSVILTDENGQKKARHFVGVKIGYDIDSPLVSSFRGGVFKNTVRNKYQNRNKITNLEFDNGEPVAEIKNFKGQDESDYVPLSCLQYIINLEDIKEEKDLISFSKIIYISPFEKFVRINKYLKYFDGLIFGKYIKPIKLIFEREPVDADGVLNAPVLRFGSGGIINGNVIQNDITLKFEKLNALKKFGFYRQPDLNSLIIIHRSSIEKKIIERFRNDLIVALSDFNLPFSETNVSIASHIDNADDLKKLAQRLDEDVVIGIIPVINDRYFNYKDVKEILNEHYLPSQAVRENTLNYSNHNNGKYKGVIQNVISGIVTKGEGIPWILSDNLSSDLIIGVDSGGAINKRAWATAYVFDEHGEKIHVRNPNFYANEGIPKEDFKELILESVKIKLLSGQRGLKLKGITIHRDGFLTKTEREGLESAITTLRVEGKLMDSFHSAAVNVKKGSNFRLFTNDGGKIENPPIGAYYIIDQQRAFVATTGYPILKSRTTKPLLIEIVNIIGKQDISNAINDIYYLSELNWGSPTSAIKLPITIYYADKMVDFADYDSKPTYLPI